MAAFALLASLCGCSDEATTVSVRRAALTTPLSNGRILHVWDRNLDTGERIALQPNTLNQCTPRGERTFTCAIASGSMIGALQSGFIRGTRPEYLSLAEVVVAGRP